MPSYTLVYTAVLRPEPSRFIFSIYSPAHMRLLTLSTACTHASFASAFEGYVGITNTRGANPTSKNSRRTEAASTSNAAVFDKTVVI